MTYEEALAWLRGDRSSVNWLQDGTPQGTINAARYDAAMTEQAYWVARAHREEFAFAENPIDRPNPNGW